MLFSAAAQVPAHAAAREARTFDIPAGDAGKSITEFARQADRQIVAPGEALRGVRTSAVRGQLDIEAALSALLQGTALRVASNDGRTVILIVGPDTADQGEAMQTTGADPVETVVVRGYRASLAHATIAKQRSVTFSDTVFAEDMGKFPDTNIAEAFNRLPGITINREIDGTGVNVSIRGLGSDFTKVLLNGSQIAVASTGITDSQNASREIDLNIFPVELFSQLTVNKSLRADQPEGGAAGTVDMRTAKPFDNPGFHLVYALKGANLDNQNALSPGGILIISDTEGPVGVLVGATAMSTRFFTRGFESIGWTNPNLLTAGPVIQCAPASSCNATGGGNWTIPTTVPANVTTGGLVPGHAIDQAYLLSLNPNVTLAQLDNGLAPRLARQSMEKGVRSRYSGLFSLEFRPSDRLHVNFDIIGARLSNAFDRSDINWIVRNGASIPLNTRVDADGVVTSATFANAQWFLEARPYHERGDFISINSGIDWQPGALLSVSFQTNASRSHFFRDVPSILVATVPSAGNPSGVPGPVPPVGGVYVKYSNAPESAVPSMTTNIDLNDPINFQWSGGRVNAQAEKRYAFTAGLRANIQYGRDTLNVKFGSAYDELFRAIAGYENSQAWQNAVCGGNPSVYAPPPNSQPPCEGLHTPVPAGYPAYPPEYRGSLIPQSALSFYLKPGPTGFVNVDYEKFLRDAHYGGVAHPNAPYTSSTNLGVNSGTIDEKIYGLYGQVNGEMPVGEGTFKFNIGLRWVSTLQTVTSPVVQEDDRNQAEAPQDGHKYPKVGTLVTDKYAYQTLLPSLNLVFEATDKLLVRASASRTMTRANPSTLRSGVSFTDPSANVVMLGNLALKPYYSNNIDIGAEYYTGGEGYVGVVAFRKSVSGFTVMETRTEPFSFLATYGITYDTLIKTMQDALDAQGGPDVATVQVSQAVNTNDHLTISGLEIDCVQPLDFLLKRFGIRGFGLSANATVIHQKAGGTSAAMATGVPPYTYNITAYYEDNGLSARMSYVFHDRHVMSESNQNGVCLPNTGAGTCPGGAYLYKETYAQLDFSSNVRLSALFGEIPSDPEIIFNVLNLTRSKLRSYFQYRQAPYAYYAQGTTYIFGLRGIF